MDAAEPMWAKIVSSLIDPRRCFFITASAGEGIRFIDLG